MDSDPRVDYKDAAAKLLARKMHMLYPRALELNPGIGPELFAENWLHAFLTDSEIEFEDAVMSYFVDLLIKKA